MTMQMQAEQLDAGQGPQLSPRVDLAYTLLKARPSGRKYPRDAQQEEYVVDLFTRKQCTAEFLAHQLSGALWMMGHRNGGLMNLPKRPPRPRDDPEVARDAKQVALFVTKSGVVRDEPGFGETLTTLLDILLNFLFGDAGTEHRCNKVVVENPALVHQWLKAMEKFPDLQPVVVAGTKPSNSPGAMDCWVNATDMQKAEVGTEDLRSRSRQMDRRMSDQSEKPRLRTGHPLLDIALDTANPQARRYALIDTYDDNRTRAFPMHWRACKKIHKDRRPNEAFLLGLLCGLSRAY